nr:TetR/AcrR family transcriptional regulator [Bacilli bacterium]
MQGEEEGKAIRRDAAKNRLHILEVASVLFSQQGVEQVSMNQIAMEAQIGSGTLYRHFRDKSELCYALINDQIPFLFEDMDDFLAEHAKEPPNQKLEGVLKRFLRFRETKRNLLFGVEEIPSKKPMAFSHQNPLFDQMHALLMAIFQEVDPSEQATGTSEFKADLLMMALRRDAYEFQREIRGRSPDEILQQLCQTFMAQPLTTDEREP